MNTHTHTPTRYHDPVPDLHLVLKFNTSDFTHKLKTNVIISYVRCSFLTVSNLCTSIAKPKVGNRSRKACWPWGVSPRNTLSLILLAYSTLHPVNGHSSNIIYVPLQWKSTHTHTYIQNDDTFTNTKACPYIHKGRHTCPRRHFKSICRDMHTPDQSLMNIHSHYRWWGVRKQHLFL